MTLPAGWPQRKSVTSWEENTPDGIYNRGWNSAIKACEQSLEAGQPDLSLIDYREPTAKEVEYGKSLEDYAKSSLKKLEAGKADISAREALEKLVNKLESVHADKSYESVWVNYHIHGGKYNGPTYTKELKNAKDILAKLPNAEAGKAFDREDAERHAEAIWEQCATTGAIADYLMAKLPAQQIQFDEEAYRKAIFELYGKLLAPEVIEESVKWNIDFLKRFGAPKGDK